MSDYVTDEDAQTVLSLARDLRELPTFLEMLDAVARLARSVEPLAASLLKARQRARMYEQQGACLGAQLQEQAGELEVARTKLAALEARLTKLAAA